MLYAVSFSWLFSGTLDMTLTGKSDQPVYTHQSLIILKFTPFSLRGKICIKICALSFTQKFLIKYEINENIEK